MFCLQNAEARGLYPGNNKHYAHSIAPEGYLLKTYPDAQKVVLGFESELFRDHRSQFFFVVPDRHLTVSRSRISVRCAFGNYLNTLDDFVGCFNEISTILIFFGGSPA